jgi:hypothetical protein
LLLPTSAVLLYTAQDAPLTPAILAMGNLIAAEDDELDPMTLLTLPEQIARWTEILQVWATAGVIMRLADSPGVIELDGDTGLSATDELAEELEPLIEQMRQVFPGAGSVLGSLPDAQRQGPVVTVTPSGRDLLARLLRGQGLTVPTVGDRADTPPAELLLALSDHDPDPVRPRSAAPTAACQRLDLSSAPAPGAPDGIGGLRRRPVPHRLEAGVVGALPRELDARTPVADHLPPVELTSTAMNPNRPNLSRPNTMNPGPTRSITSASHNSIATIRHRPTRPITSEPSTSSRRPGPFRRTRSC